MTLLKIMKKDMNDLKIGRYGVYKQDNFVGVGHILCVIDYNIYDLQPVCSASILMLQHCFAYDQLYRASKVKCSTLYNTYKL